MTKSKLVLLSATIALSHNAFAQTSTATASVAPAAAAATNIASDNTAAKESDVKLSIKYTGIAKGPGLDFSAAHQAATNSRKDIMIDNRPKILLAPSKNFDFGMEARVNSIFTEKGATAMRAENGNYRLLANFKNVYKDNLFAMTLTPRLILPTSMGAHNADQAIVSPEFLINLDITPKNSRFSFNAGDQIIQLLHNSKVNAANTVTALNAPWIEADYQLNAKTSLALSYWPEMVANARIGAPLANDANEIDLGVNYEVAKGWTLNPFMTAELNGMDTSSPLPNMQVNVALSGSFL